jgi:hypothetical protein
MFSQRIPFLYETTSVPTLQIKTDKCPGIKKFGVTF